MKSGVISVDLRISSKCSSFEFIKSAKDSSKIHFSLFFKFLLCPQSEIEILYGVFKVKLSSCIVENQSNSGESSFINHFQIVNFSEL